MVAPRGARFSDGVIERALRTAALTLLIGVTTLSLGLWTVIVVSEARPLEVFACAQRSWGVYGRLWCPGLVAPSVLACVAANGRADDGY